MSYTSSVASSYKGANQAAKIGATRNEMLRQQQNQWRGPSNERKKKKKKKGAGASSVGDLASQFGQRYRINEQVMQGYDNMIGGSAQNLQGINSGYLNREQLASQGMNQLADSYNARTALAAQQASDINAGYMSREALAAQQLDAINQSYQDRLARNMGYMDSAKANELNAIDQAYKERAASSMQDLVSRGLRNSSLGATTNTGIEKAKQQSILDVNESIRQQRLAADSQLSEDALRAARDAMGVRADLSGDTLRSQRDALGIEADLSGEALRNRRDGIGIQADLSGDRLGFGERGNNVQNQLLQNKLNFTASTKADYPGYSEMMSHFQNLAAAGGGAGGQYGGMAAGRRNKNLPKHYVAGLSAMPLSSLGYDVPNLTTMPAANLASGMRGDMSGFRRDTPFPGIVAKEEAERAARSARTMERLMKRDSGYQPYVPSTTYEPSSRLNPPSVSVPQATMGNVSMYEPSSRLSPPKIGTSPQATYEPSSRLNPPKISVPQYAPPPSYRYGSTMVGPPPSMPAGSQVGYRINDNVNFSTQQQLGSLTPAERAYVDSQRSSPMYEPSSRLNPPKYSTYRKPAAPKAQMPGFKPGLHADNLTANWNWFWGR